VAVQSEELSEIPSELAAERVQSLAVPTFTMGRTGLLQGTNQQQEQQQQGSDGELNFQQMQQQQWGRK
jgi:hypothetical protein